MITAIKGECFKEFRGLGKPVMQSSHSKGRITRHGAEMPCVQEARLSRGGNEDGTKQGEGIDATQGELGGGVNTAPLDEDSHSRQ